MSGESVYLLIIGQTYIDAKSEQTSTELHQTVRKTKVSRNQFNKFNQ